MAEYIERKRAVVDACNALELYPSEYAQLEDALNKVPAADVAPVIRCHECKYCDPENYHCDHPMGTAAPLRREPDDFCSYGERKDGDD